MPLDDLLQFSIASCRPEHWDAAIHVVRYFNGTRLFSLELGGTNPIRTVAYANSDYANCLDTSRSIGAYWLSLGFWYRLLGLSQATTYSRFVTLRRVHCHSQRQPRSHLLQTILRSALHSYS